MIFHANNGDISEALMMWDELTNSSFVPNLDIVSSLIEATKRGYFEEVVEVLNWLKSRGFSWLPQAYTAAVHCFGIGGEFPLMDATLREMVSIGFPVDSVKGNVCLLYYSRHASLREMEAAYGRIKRSRILIEESAIHSMSTTYTKRKKFHELGEFLRDVGLAMVESGFQPDLKTSNIRALAFSWMNLFWDLHLSLQHIKHANVAPDLITYGCVVDAYLDKKNGRNLNFVLNRMTNKDDPHDDHVFGTWTKTQIAYRAADWFKLGCSTRTIYRY